MSEYCDGHIYDPRDCRGPISEYRVTKPGHLIFYPGQEPAITTFRYCQQIVEQDMRRGWTVEPLEMPHAPPTTGGDDGEE